jgi:hypothetical protein
MSAMRYDDAVASLYQAPVDQFVTERKRLAGELKAAGDKAGAAQLAKLARPPVSAWAVDQLWWQARPAFDALFETAARLRDGKLDAMAAHRDAIARLRAEATRILTAAEHAATEATLRKVTQTLAALAATGSWEPDAPGALAADRDPPGFEAVGITSTPAAPAAPAHDKPAKSAHENHAHAHDKPAHAHDKPVHAHGKPAHAHDKPHTHAAQPARDAEAAGTADAEAADAEAARAAEAQRRRAEREAAAARAEAAEAQRRAEAARARAAAERQRIEAALRTARGDVTVREREVGKLERELATARELVDQAKAAVDDLAQRLAQLES